MTGVIQAILCCLCGAGISPDSPGSDRPANDPAIADVVFFDRLQQTFVLLNGIVLPAYLDHFRDEPDKSAVVHFYAGRLAEVQKDPARASEHFQKSAGVFLDRPTADKPPANSDGATPQQWMAAALATLAQAGRPKAEVGYEPAEILEHHLNNLGAKPHVVLQRRGISDGPDTTANCPLYDPELFFAHRRLWELKTKSSLTAEPSRIHESLAKAHARISQLRQQPTSREMSLRRFLDVESHRVAAREVFWLYRCLAVEQEKAGDPTAAHESLLRAWAVGDALFPVSERGRMERLDRVFLAELGDVYARLGRFDLMLRYMYSQQGLPARYEMARPVAELARVAESVRLARHDESAADQLDEFLPETVSQILFEQPVLNLPPGTRATIGSIWYFTRSGQIGWWLVGSGAILMMFPVAWFLSRAVRRSRAGAAPDKISQG